MKRYLMLPLMLLTACEGTNLNKPTTVSEQTAMSPQKAVSEKKALSQQKTKVRIATFNVSMEALNYLPHVEGQAPQVQGNELANSLAANHQQIRNIAEIIQRINPDIILLNEFDRQDDSHQSLKTFLKDYLGQSQQGQEPLEYPYFFQGPVNTGVPAPFDVNNNGKEGESPADTYGFGFFPGHFAMALLSKYPISHEKIRTFQHFKWQDMPGALQPIDPETNKPWYNSKAWQQMRLSSKSHWDVPVTVNGQTVHILASHPTPPVFDGPEDRNGKRNHDEIRFWLDYITPGKGGYIYDDNANKGGYQSKAPFVIMGDQNASSVEGDAINTGITALLSSPQVNDPNPASSGAEEYTQGNPHGKHHTAYWGMRADYVLPSSFGWEIKDSGVFWPKTGDDTYRLIKDRQASSDHRLVWVDLELPANNK